MPDTVEAPVDFMEAVAHLRLPESADRRLQELMDANTEGRLSPAERGELESLVEWSESLSLLRARAMQVLGGRPK